MEVNHRAQETWLVGHDLSPVSDVALVEAARIVENLGGRLVLLHVHPRLRLRPEEAWGQITFGVEEALRTRLADVVVELRRHHPHVAVVAHVVAAGDPARAILDEARRVGASHVVVGTHDRRGFEHLVLGSVAEKVARDATVPVTIVRRLSTEGST